MTEKGKRDLLEELESSSLTEILELHTLYFNVPEERKFVEKFLIDNFNFKPFNKFQKSLKNIPENLKASEREKRVIARTVARDIVEHIDYEAINNLKDIEYIVSTEMKKFMF